MNAEESGTVQRSAEPYLQIRDLSKVFPTRQGETRALDGVSLTIARGEFVAILGPSGCGKSTMMLMVAGLLRPSGGDVRVADRPVDKPITDVGIVFQNAVLLDWLTVFGNAMFVANLRHLPKAQVEPRARELLRA